jgi:hypothetical protein
VLISPLKIGEPDWANQALPAQLKAETIKESPGIGTDLPVSLQKRIELEQHMVWGPHWPPVGSALGSIPPTPPEAPKKTDLSEQTQGDPRLRSTREVINYHIETMEGSLGHVEDFIVHTDSWMLFYLVVDTRNWLPGRKVLVPVDWISRVEWADFRVDVDLTRKEVKNSPPFDPAAGVNREYETKLYDFYGRPKYWV